MADLDRRRVGAEIRTARTILGRSIDAVSAAAGISSSQVGRIERGVLRTASLDQLASVGAVVGLDVRLRCYPGIDVPRDAGQLAVERRFRPRLHMSLRVRSEVPLPIIGDQRAWDWMISDFLDDGDPLPTEFESRLVDVQAQARRIQLKLRDARLAAVLLVVPDTRANRAALAAAGASLTADFPIPARTALAALAAGRHPGGSSIIRI